MSASITIDIARVELLLSELRLPGVKLMWAKLAAQSDKEGWPALASSAAWPNSRSPTVSAAAPNAT